MATKNIHHQAPVYGRVDTAAQLGRLVREHRKGLHQVTLAQTASVSGVGPRFISELERGKDTAEIGKALHVIQQLGLDVWIVPRGVTPGTSSASRVVSSLGSRK
ncbi:MAG TPA: transcriptional regulator [Gammaproteobacteria bacterium]|nr:transcriptional regulator [Gammaproteobacteria bacterium]